MKINKHDKKEIEHLIEFKKQFIKLQSLTKQERMIRFLKAMRGEK